VGWELKGEGGGRDEANTKRLKGGQERRKGGKGVEGKRKRVEREGAM
jgi:hypothetical protein